jgi:Inositol hexakisphosphate
MLEIKCVSIIGRCVVVLEMGYTEIRLDLAYRFLPIVQLKYAFRGFPYPLVSWSNTKDNYVDAYLRVIKNADPLRTSVVFSCGMGAVRTTFAMTAACVLRRRQLILRGQPDPYATKFPNSPLLSSPASGNNTVS